MMMRMKSSFNKFLLLFLLGTLGASCAILPGKGEPPLEEPARGSYGVQSILTLEGNVAPGPGGFLAVLKGSEITIYQGDEPVKRITGAPKGRLQWGLKGEFLYYIEYDNFIAPYHWMNAGTLKRYSLRNDTVTSLSLDNNVTFYTISEELYYISLGSLYRGIPDKGLFRFEKIINGFCIVAYPLDNHIAVYRRMGRELLEVVDKKGGRIAVLEKEPVKNRLLPAYVLSVCDDIILLDARGRREAYRLDGKSLIPATAPAEPLAAKEIHMGETAFRWELESKRLTLYRVNGGESQYLTHVKGARPLEFSYSGERLILRWSDGALVIRLTQTQ